VIWRAQTNIAAADSCLDSPGRMGNMTKPYLGAWCLMRWSLLPANTRDPTHGRRSCVHNMHATSRPRPQSWFFLPPCYCGQRRHLRIAYWRFSSSISPVFLFQLLPILTALSFLAHQSRIQLHRGGALTFNKHEWRLLMTFSRHVFQLWGSRAAASSGPPPSHAMTLHTWSLHYARIGANTDMWSSIPNTSETPSIQPDRDGRRRSRSRGQ